MEEFCGSEFWNSSVTWNTSQPHFTPCFEKTLLVWIPCFYLWLLIPIEVYFLKKSRNGAIPWTWLNISKIIGSLLLLATEASLLIAKMAEDSTVVNSVDYLYPSLLFISILLQLIFVVLEKRKGVQTSGYLFGFWLLMLIGGLPGYRTQFLYHDSEEDPTAGFITYMIYFPLVVIMFVLNSFADKRPFFSFYSRGKKPSPELDASFLNKLVFGWLELLIWKGYREPLTQEVLWDLTHDNSSKAIVQKWDRNWEDTIHRYNNASHQNGPKYLEFGKKASTKKRKKISLFPILFKSFGFEFGVAVVLKFIHDILQFVPPLMIRLLISFAEDESLPTWRGYFYSVVIFISLEFQSLLMAHQSLIMYRIGLRIRTAVTSSIYRKALKISNPARKESTVGEIVNLMSVDVQRLMDLMAFINMVWSAPLQIALCLYFLWLILGASALVGVAVLILLIPINIVIANKQKILQIIQMKEKDKRVRLMSEILNGIKVLKLYAWEPSFINQVTDIRRKEIKVIKKAAYLGAAVSFVFTCTPFMVSFFMFMTYVLSSPEHILYPDTVFVSLSLLNILKMPMTLLPMLIIYLVQASVSLKRLNRFINADELDPESVEKDPAQGNVMRIENGSFSWSSEAEDRPVLDRINLQIKEGSLVGVVGLVGSGKSSLCSALLGEMEKISGRVYVNKSVAYVPQQAWIQNATLKENILFSRSSDQNFYDKIVDSCALKQDFEMLPAGDQTEIGEKGINLSGGQKQRVSLARAIYSGADIYLLDDPLSAVDSHVGKHIFERVIGPQGLLKNKTRILVTHGLNYIRSMDHIIVLKDGRISEQGTYMQLISQKGEFQEFILQHLSQEDDEDDALEDIKSEVEKTIGREELQRQISVKRSESFGSQKSYNASVRRRRSSRRSVHSVASSDKTNDDKKFLAQKLIKEETSETGKVSRNVYLYYMAAMGIIWTTLALIFYNASQAFYILGSILLSNWSDNENGADPSVRNKYLGVYAVFGIGQGLTILFGYAIIARSSIVGSKKLHNIMLDNVMRSPMFFFDMTPLGRIVNRFSKDIDTLDIILPSSIRSFLLCLTTVIFTFVVIIYATPMFTVVIIPAMVIYFFVQSLYVTSSRQLKRLEAVSRSPIYSHFGESVQGASTIRAYGLQKEFILQSEERVDYNQKSYYININCYRWLSLRLELIGSILTFFAAFFTVQSRGDISGGDVGLSVSYATSVTQMLNYLVRMSSDVETNIVSVERIKEYSELRQEAAWEIPANKPDKKWPSKGEVSVKNYSTRYREGLELVIRNINCKIEPMEKVGIVGRTGAGKSSLTLALFRIIESGSGSIIIDGVDISTIGLHDLRSKLTIIPQDPVLFSGNLRMNLDPFSKYGDEAVWDALEHSHLKAFVAGLNSKLQHEITEGGENLSVGQRQLVCLARALLRKTKVLILDEATAAVDLETDDLIQETIRREFADCTVITIAHRLNTIMDSTRIIVLDKGEIREFASPQLLLQDTNSVFYGMAKDAGLV